ncbi:MAG: hypothetical protein HOI35_01930 [Woeseia sp.]|jgi:hypothetical protein|nr:hypothetical protein [Woeseia sp.]MBT6208767.1 hypothetical protein [Woeseia sp.]
MGLRFSIDLDDDDLRHFRLIMRDARKASARLAPDDIVAAAEALLTTVDRRKISPFISERLTKLEIDAYTDFCDFRRTHVKSKGIKNKTTDLTRDSWLDGRRTELQARMRRRRDVGSANQKPGKIL